MVKSVGHRYGQSGYFLKENKKIKNKQTNKKQKNPKPNQNKNKKQNKQ